MSATKEDKAKLMADGELVYFGLVNVTTDTFDETHSSSTREDVEQFRQTLPHPENYRFVIIRAKLEQTR